MKTPSEEEVAYRAPRPGEPRALPVLTQETELKFAASADDIEGLLAGPFMKGLKGRVGRGKDLISIYYDTPDLGLRGIGWTLRVRQAGRKFQQTLKSASESQAGVMTRDEWSVPVTSTEPELDALPHGKIRKVLGHLSSVDLKPIFVTRVKRRTATVQMASPQSSLQSEGSAEIEIAFDSGVIEAGGRIMPLSEIELELVSGSPARLFDLALWLIDEIPGRLETRSKSSRGYALARNERPAWVKSGTVPLKPVFTVEQAMALILRECLDHCMANQAASWDGSDQEGVHQMRIALRRLRSALSIFGDLLPEGDRTWIVDEAKWITSNLGPARNWDVFISELIPPVHQGLPARSELGALEEAAEEARARVYDRVRGLLANRRYTAFVLRFSQWIEKAAWRERLDDAAREAFELPIMGFADRLLSRRYKSALKLGKGFARLSADDRHQVRISLKKLRYGIEFFSPLYARSKAQPYLKALKLLQDQLGHLNDVVTAEQLLAKLVEDVEQPGRRVSLHTAAGEVLGWYAHGVAISQPGTLLRWRKFKKAKVFWHPG